MIDPELVATLTDRPTEDVSAELVESGLAYRDPANPDQFVRAERYLSGVVESKLETARQGVLDDPRFQANVDALEQALPERIEQGIEVRPGATWLPEQYYQQFAAEKFGIPERHIKVEHHNDTWTVDVDKNFWEYAGDADQRYGVVAAQNVMGGRYNFSASGKASSYRNQGVAVNRNDGVVATAPQMFESVLNLSAPPMNWSKSWREEHPDSPQQHAAASTFAGRKARQVRDEFSAWVMSDPQRRTEVLDRYNQIFNSYVAAKWDGSQRSMPGLGTNFMPYGQDPGHRLAVQIAGLAHGRTPRRAGRRVPPTPSGRGRTTTPPSDSTARSAAAPTSWGSSRGGNRIRRKGAAARYRSWSGLPVVTAQKTTKFA